MAGFLDSLGGFAGSITDTLENVADFAGSVGGSIGRIRGAFDSRGPGSFVGWQPSAPAAAVEPGPAGELQLMPLLLIGFGVLLLVLLLQR